MKLWTENQYDTFFRFQRILCKKESEEVCELIWRNFDSFAKLYLIQKACFKSSFYNRGVLYSLPIQKDLDLVFRSTPSPEKFFKKQFLPSSYSEKMRWGDEVVSRSLFVQNLLTKFFLLQYDINWQNIINTMCLLPKLFSKMYFLFYVQIIDNVRKFEYIILKFDFLANGKSF